MKVRLRHRMESIEDIYVDVKVGDEASAVEARSRSILAEVSK